MDRENILLLRAREHAEFECYFISFYFCWVPAITRIKEKKERQHGPNLRRRKGGEERMFVWDVERALSLRMLNYYVKNAIPEFDAFQLVLKVQSTNL